jgi:hypothetical protein
MKIAVLDSPAQVICPNLVDFMPEFTQGFIGMVNRSRRTRVRIARHVGTDEYSKWSLYQSGHCSVGQQLNLLA